VTARAGTAAMVVVLAAVAVGVSATPAFASAQLISTAAGTGVAGNTGDGGLATSAQLNTPAGVSVDGAGDVFIADYGANVVRKIAPTGVISTVAGSGVAGYTGDGGTATSARLSQPTDVVVGPNGWLYIADSANHVVRAVRTDGKIVTVAGTGTAGHTGDGGLGVSARLATPVGLDVDTTGNVWIADYGNGTVRKLSAAGYISTVAGTATPGYSGDGGPATAAMLKSPGDVASSGSTLYIADAGNARIRKVDASGTISTIAGTGTPGYSGDGGAATAATLAFPAGVVVDSSGDVFVADYSSNVIRKIAAGVITTVAGTGTAGFSGDGGAATAAKLANPARVNLDAAGDLYVSDWTNHRVREVTALGTAAVAPGAPTGAVATAGDAQALVSWTAPASNGGSALTGYAVTGTDGTNTVGPVNVGPGTTSATVGGLTNGTSYTFTVTASNAVGTSPPSAASAPVTPAASITVPGAPTGVAATAGDAQAVVSWTAPASDGGSALTGFAVTGSDGTTTVGPVAVGAGTTTTTIGGLANGTAYTFTVTASNAAGTSAPSSPSAPVTPVAPAGGGSGGGSGGGPVATVPDAPTHVTAKAGNADVTVGWTAPANDGGSPITGYVVRLSDGHTTTGVTVGASTTQVTVPGLTNGTSYAITVAASNSIGTSVPSAPVSAVPVAPVAPKHNPPAPTTSVPAPTTTTTAPPAAPAGGSSTPVTVWPVGTRSTTSTTSSTSSAPHPARHSHRHPAAKRPAARTPVATPPAPTTPEHRRATAQPAPRSTFALLERVAAVATKTGAMPVGLLALIGLFLLIQDRLDRRDPKLALAPVYADPGISFVPAMS